MRNTSVKALGLRLLDEMTPSVAVSLQKNTCDTRAKRTFGVEAESRMALVGVKEKVERHWAL